MGAYGTPHSSPSPAAAAGCHGRMATHPGYRGQKGQKEIGVNRLQVTLNITEESESQF